MATKMQSFLEAQGIVRDLTLSVEIDLPLPDVTRKVISLLRKHPDLLAETEMHEELRIIKSKVVETGTKEYRLFQRLVEIPVITVYTSNGTLPVLSSLLTFQSKKIEAEWSFGGKDSFGELHLESFSWEEIRTAIAFLQSEDSKLISTENSWRMLALADYLDIPLLSDAALDTLMCYFEKVQPSNFDELGQVVSLFNSDLIDSYPTLKFQLEEILSSSVRYGLVSELYEDFLEIKKHLQHLTKPFALDLSQSPITHFHLAAIQKLPIYALALNHCPNLNPYCLSMLQNTDMLERIDARKNDWVDDDFILELKRLPHLKYLDLSGCNNASPEGFEHLPETLSYLKLMKCEAVTDNLAPKIARMKKLKKLEVSFTAITDAFLDTIPEEIEALMLFGCTGITDASAIKFAKMHKIKTLELGDIAITNRTIQVLGNQIEKLYLVGCEEITDACAAKISQMKHLKKLDLSHTDVSDRIIDQLPKNLESLDLGNCDKITDTSSEKFASFVHLKNLRLSHTSITDKTVQALGDSIKILKLTGCQGVTNASAQKLSNMPNLTVLHTQKTAMTERVRPLSNNFYLLGV